MSNRVLTLFFCVVLVGCGRPYWAAPSAISDAELNAMDLPYAVGDKVFVKSGPFKGHIGTVEYIDGFTGRVMYRVKLSERKSGPIEPFMQHFESDVLSKMMENANPFRVQPPEESWNPFLPDKKTGR